jgi:glycosyltransferase involved in cell wall biosynthesis
MLRQFLRNSEFAAKLIKTISFMPLPYSIKQKFTSFYLQSEALRPELSQVLEQYINDARFLAPKAEIVLSKSAIIKARLPGEKGCILVGFEHELDRLVAHVQSDAVLADYDVLFMPTWQPFYSFALLRMLKKNKQSLVLLPSSQSCYYKAMMLPEHFRALPFHASSWVDGSLYEPKPKDIDILMVANFSIYKRHKLLFAALAHLPRDLKVVLIGRPLADRKLDDIMNEAKAFGVQDRFEIIEAPANDVVRDHLCRAKLVLGLSGREGSYVSLAEALFADAAVAVFANAHIGTKNYINPQTGFLLQPDVDLARQIRECLKKVGTLAPRAWAIANISAQVNVNKLNALLKHDAVMSNNKWTNNCDAFHIQSFEMEPLAGEWSNAIKNEVLRFDALGIKFRKQLTSLSSADSNNTNT